MTDDELLQRVWKLTNDLTIQQQTNQDIASGIKTQIETFKQRTTNDQDDKDLDINLPELLPSSHTEDSNNDTITSILPKHTQLLQEHRRVKTRNQELEKECTELQELVKQYEENLEMITGKLRVYANSSSEGQSQLRREYEALLDAEKDTTAALFMENTFLQSQLIKLSGMLRNTYECDTATTIPHDSQLQQLLMENEGLRTLLKISEHQSTTSSTNRIASSFLTKQSSTPSLQIGKPSSQVMQDYFGESSNST
ncbi:hypothetical protein [Absidia glauca]|uniref:Uncharacterized protein n=1 Tax=Absidia glauca TaxID=4829 RepID=A0A168NRS5_ABSGL|nr:hypothetical protein [Absidia glauca]